MKSKAVKAILSGVIAVASGFAAQPALAAPATVIDEFGCGGFVPDPDTPSGLPALASLLTLEKTHAVVTANGNTTLTCHFNHTVALSRASGAKGFLCGTFAGLTTDSMMIATPGGKATLVCKINAQK